MKYDKETNELHFSSGTSVYCFGGNPSIGMDCPETLDYSYGSDGGFGIGKSVRSISLVDAIEMADRMIITWNRHRAYLAEQLDAEIRRGDQTGG